MKINKQLSIVIPVDVDGAPKAMVPQFNRDGSPLMDEVTKKQVELEEVQPYYVYSSPLSRVVFERYWMIFSKAHAAIYGEGLNVISGPRIAALAMRDIARSMGRLDGPDGVEHGVFDEMRRTSVIIVPGQKGTWEQVLLQDAINKDLITADDVSEVENILAFFIVISALHRAAERGPILEGAARLWDARILLSSCSEFMSSLPKLTATASSGGVRIAAA